jgi:Glycosyl hydrolase family 26
VVVSAARRIASVAAALVLVLAATGTVGTGTGRSAVRRHTVALGVNLQTVTALGGIDRFARLVGAQPKIVMWFQAFSEPLYWPGQLPDATHNGAIPMITWDPDYGSGGGAYSMRRIADGGLDGYLITSAKAAARWHGTVFIRFAHEMNGGWYKWGDGSPGNTATDYIAAWRHVVRLFRSHGANNVRWVWSPNAMWGRQYPFKKFYPGDRWVDWVALDGYNWGSLKGSGWRGMRVIFQSSYAKMRSLTHKPLMIAETAAPEAGGDKARWIRNGFLRTLPRYMPAVRAVIWFDRIKETDWRVNSSAAALRAYRQVVALPRYRPTRVNTWR